jgi:hypothetical protein
MCIFKNDRNREDTRIGTGNPRNLNNTCNPEKLESEVNKFPLYLHFTPSLFPFCPHNQITFEQKKKRVNCSGNFRFVYDCCYDLFIIFYSIFHFRKRRVAIVVAVKYVSVFAMFSSVRNFQHYITNTI